MRGFVRQRVCLSGEEDTDGLDGCITLSFCDSSLTLLRSYPAERTSNCSLNEQRVREALTKRFSVVNVCGVPCCVRVLLCLMKRQGEDRAGGHDKGGEGAKKSVGGGEDRGEGGWKVCRGEMGGTW